MSDTLKRIRQDQEPQESPKSVDKKAKVTETEDPSSPKDVFHYLEFMTDSPEARQSCFLPLDMFDEEEIKLMRRQEPTMTIEDAYGDKPENKLVNVISDKICHYLEDYKPKMIKSLDFVACPETVHFTFHFFFIA